MKYGKEVVKGVEPYFNEESVDCGRDKEWSHQHGKCNGNEVVHSGWKVLLFHCGEKILTSHSL